MPRSSLAGRLTNLSVVEEQLDSPSQRVRAGSTVDPEESESLLQLVPNALGNLVRKSDQARSRVDCSNPVNRIIRQFLCMETFRVFMYFVVPDYCGQISATRTGVIRREVTSNPFRFPCGMVMITL